MRLRAFSAATVVGTAALVLLSPPVATAQDDPCDGAPDVVFFGGNVITMEPDKPAAEAIAISGNEIIAVGSNEEIRALVATGCGTGSVDLNGLTVLPGFNDSHSHWFSWREHICSVTGETTYPSLEGIMRMLSANGWTSISELNFGRPDHAPEHLNNALDLEARGLLSVRLNGYWGTLDDGSLIDVLAEAGRTPATHYGDRIRAIGVKMYVDDPFGTADLLSEDQTLDLVRRAHADGWQVAAHAVNETAVEKILVAYEDVLGEETNDGRRHRIEHAVKVTDDQLGRMKDKGIVASFQLMGPPDWPSQTTFQTYISNTHPEWCLRWNDFDLAQDEGLHVTGSTDAPFNDAPCDYSPFRVVHQAVTRIGYLDRTHADWELAQRLSIESSLRALTRDGAYATFEEDQKGTLKPGKWADIVVVSDDPLSLRDPDDLLEITTHLTMVGGEVEYCSPDAPASLCDPSESFRVDSLLITASAYLQDQTPDFAFDGRTATNWGAGDHPPQWIEVDLGGPVEIDQIDLLIDQYPAGRTVHRVEGKTDESAAGYDLLHEFDGVTSADQVLSYAVPAGMPPYRFVRIRTTESPSWVSWKEITITPRTTSTQAEQLLPGSTDLILYPNHPNPVATTTTIAFELPAPGSARVEVFDLLGRRVSTVASGSFGAGRSEVVWSAAGIPSGLYVLRLTVGASMRSAKLIVRR